MKQNNWVCYIVECSDGTLYTGVTNNIDKRLRAHNGEIKGGAKYTSKRRPVKLMVAIPCEDKSNAMKLEYKIKKMSRKEKLAIINK